MFTSHSFNASRLRCCESLTGYANVLTQNSFVVSFGGGLMKKLVAMVFFAMVAGNAMAQAGGAAGGAGAGGGAAAGAAAGTIATVAAAVVGVAAATANNSTASSH